jgi:hypothetical protein
MTAIAIGTSFLYGSAYRDFPDFRAVEFADVTRRRSRRRH